MKSLRKISKISIVAICFVCCAACNRDAIYEEEQYKYVVYLLSGSGNVFTESYTLNETMPVRYFSVGCGGSKPNREEVVVTLEPDGVLLDQYNRNNFDIDESKYACLLSADRYEVESYTVTIPANPEEQYVKVPVKVRPLGLSPDTIYFIPLAINSVSRYEVNEDKYNMLYRVTIENDYARQSVTTYYTKRGTETNQSTGAATILSGTKKVQPYTKDQVRMFVGNFPQDQLTTVEDIQRYAMLVQIKEDRTVDIKSYGTVEIEVLNANGYNLYDPAVQQGLKKYRELYLHYRYKILNSNGVRGEWIEAKETLTRVEED